MAQVEFLLEPGHKIAGFNFGSDDACRSGELAQVLGCLAGFCLDRIEISLKGHDELPSFLLSDPGLNLPVLPRPCQHWLSLKHTRAKPWILCVRVFPPVSRPCRLWLP